MRAECLCISVLRVASGPSVKLASCKSVYPPPPPLSHPSPVVYSTDRSKAVVPVLVLLFAALWFILRGHLFLCLTVWYFVLVFFSPFSIASLVEDSANHSVFRTFVQFARVCLFPLPLGVWEGLRFAMVAFPGLFSSFFFFQMMTVG